VVGGRATGGLVESSAIEPSRSVMDVCHRFELFYRAGEGLSSSLLFGDYWQAAAFPRAISTHSSASERQRAFFSYEIFGFRHSDD
jgi:hypothetical protein